MECWQKAFFTLITNLPFMKKILTMILIAAFAATAARAQSAYDAANIAQKDLNGTARFVGMGGAMSALGGDISTIGTNPAGIGIYRSNDAMLTFGYSSTGTESKYDGNTFEANKNRWNFDNIGFVLSTKISNVAPLRYVNFGFNYHKSKSFYKNMNMQGDLRGLSQTFQMATQADGLTPDYWDDSRYGHFDNPDIGWLSALGFNGWLINPDLTTTPTDFPYTDADGNQIYTEDGKPLYEDYDYYTSIAGNDVYLRDFHSRERGGIDQYDFNVAFNVNDRFYFGITLGAYDVDYSKYTYYDEDYGTGAGYLLESFNWIKGAGVDLKFGTIFRPIAASPLRIGLSVHTPVFYKLTYTTGAYLQSDVFIGDERVTYQVDTQAQLNGDMEREFQLQTPWVFNASLGYTVGNFLALGAEYEYEDYSSMKFHYHDGELMDYETDQVKQTLKGVSTLRVGVEYKPIPAFSLRAGYNYSSALHKSGAYKALPINSINTDTDYANNRALNTFTLGIGYRGSWLYADLAYKYDTYKSDFYPFENVDLTAAEVTNTRSQVLLTIGTRF